MAWKGVLREEPISNTMREIKKERAINKGRAPKLVEFELIDGKDEYYGYWDKCLNCQHSQPEGNFFCAWCGGLFNRKEKKI